MMPSDMRLQCPSEDTPPSTRPPSVASSAASTSGTPHRSTSMDSLHTNSSSDKPMGEEYIPTRLIRASPKANANALQFIKTGPALLHKSAKEQMKKAEVVKSLRKTSLQEEEEWQSNLDKWKSSRRKRNEDVLERVIEVKKFEQQDEFENSRGRRKSKTFNEMREDKNRRGRRYNLVVHDDDNNDLSELGLNASKNGSSLSDAPDEPESTRNADAKSDAGFCTGSDTGSDGVFAEDSISDTSSALDYEMKPAKADAPEMKELKPLSVSCENVIEAASQQELPQVPPPRVPESPQLRVPDMLPSTVMETSNHQASSLVTPSSKKSEFQEPTNIAKIPRKLPELPNVTRAQDIVSPKPYHRSEVPDNTLSTVPDNALSTVPDTTFSKVPDTTFSKVPDDTLSRVPDDTLSRVPDGTLSRVPDATLSRVPDTNLSQIPDTSVAQVPDTSLPKMPESSLPKMSDVMPPPVPPPRVPTIEDPHSARVGLCLENSSLGSSSPKREADEGEGCRAKDVPRKTGIASTNLEYGDKDIDEVIDTYEHLSEAITIGDGQAYLSTPPQQSLEENLYERIAEDEPVYENIYEKVPDDSETTSGAEGSLEHQYQTLEEVNAEKANLSPPPPVSPTLPPKSKTLSVFEVLDVTWTEDGSSAPAAPPSEPPPPPPPEEEGGEEELEGPIQGGESSPASIAPSAPPVENEGRCDKAATSSPQLPKHSLRQQMSDFLGSKPYVEEEVNLQPPPDVSELLRKEREAERLIVQRQASLTRESSLPDSDISSGSMAPFGRPRYTWEDRMKADGPKSKVDLDESSDHLEFQTKLAELEQEMEKHDRHMLQRIKGPTTSTHVSQSAPRERVSSPPQYSDKQVVGESPVPAFPELPTTAPTPTVTPPKLPPAPQLMTNTPPSVSTTAGLPIQEFYTAPSFPKYEIENTAATTVESSSPSISTNIGFSARSKPVHENTFTEPATMTRAVETNRVERPDNAASKGTQHAPPPLPRKSILALSAIPKPRLTDNDSWIMKKKEANKKDYSKHWLIQEAEQRRLEQQDRISRPSQLPLSKPTNSFQGTPGYQNHFQNIKSSFHNTSPTAYNNSTSFSSSSSSSSSIAANRPGIVYHNGPNPSPMYPANDSSNKYISNTRSSTLPSSNNINNTYNNNNNSWKKQTKTYQPPQPSPPAGSNKPLPDAIINTITQRVNNKNKMNGSARPTIYSSVNAATTTTAYRADDSYHDYMNTDSFSTVHNNIPLGLPHVIPQGSQQQGLGTVPHLPVGNQPPGLANEDQRLLSVSGKKKCSHCGEELGRGAAMIIESLRLFYHIPCFKCCVCNTQLGNGTSGADVRVRNHKLHCHNCYSNDEGMKFSKV